ncbi:MAG: TlpA family protein disulfide reductase [Verrucomicrobia bacterium]|nr:TlpA family protein disulfide reductase [Verrucomicrobiota bacterium]
MKTPWPDRVPFFSRTPSLLMVLMMCLCKVSAAVPDQVSDFELPVWNSDTRHRLSSFNGGIVVIDFFAYWCAPCKSASIDLRTRIEEPYSASGGNPAGVPVHVVSINIEADQPEETQRFIRETGIKRVWSDPDGAVLKNLGGEALPFIVVVDLSQGGGDRYPVLYSSLGLGRLSDLKAAIDKVRPPSPSQKSESLPHPGAPTLLETASSRSESLAELGFEGFVSSDIDVFDTAARYAWKKSRTELSAGLNWRSIAIEYAPDALDILGTAEHRSEDYYSGQFSLRQRVSTDLSFTVGGGAYEGYTDYRSLWLDHYYRQQFSSLPEYQYADPRGFQASGGLRWDYIPGGGFIEAVMYYGNDAIARGWDLPSPTVANPVPALESGRQILHTYAPAIRLENVLSPRVRLQNEFQITVTSGREPRYAYRGGLNIALSERWTLRLSGGYANEDPKLVASFASALFECEVTRGWFLSFSGRGYQDTGEIENSRLISTSAPALHTFQGGLGIRHEGERLSFRVHYAPHFAQYDPPGIGSQPFSNLYRNRTWGLLQAAMSYKF